MKLLSSKMMPPPDPISARESAAIEGHTVDLCRPEGAKGLYRRPFRQAMELLIVDRMLPEIERACRLVKDPLRGAGDLTPVLFFVTAMRRR